MAREHTNNQPHGNLEDRGGQVSAGQFGGMSRKIEKALHRRQHEWCKEVVLELFSRILHQEAPEPTPLEQYGDVFDLTQVESLVKYQEHLMAAPAAAIHPAERVMAQLVQLHLTDAALQGLLGYLWKLRKTISVADDNLRGVLSVILEQTRADEPVVEMTDQYQRTWHAYPSALTPESVVFRRKPKTRGKDKKKRKPRARR